MTGVPIPFTKMVGTGNDFVVVDAVARSFGRLRARWGAVSRALCDRHAGIGADGLLVLERSPRADVRMRVFNPDGSEAEMCGNGARCVARYLQERIRRRGDGKAPVTIETRAGLIAAKVLGRPAADGARRVAMRMTDPTGLRLEMSLPVEGRRLRLGFVNAGVPHAVVSVASLDAVDVARLGRLIRRHRAFAPAGANVNFIQPDARHPSRLRVRTYERGVEGETLACGTGAAASAVVYGARRQLVADGAMPSTERHRYEVQVQSGEVMAVSFRASRAGRTPRVTDLMLEGGAEQVFEGTVVWPGGRG
ncbi:MAG: diaminopimelate epimerase [Candidatus Omnitrophica bacterium]|nr:diaminopimelate epimerase [Candidatus Omnitrophota bacterium]